MADRTRVVTPNHLESLENTLIKQRQLRIINNKRSVITKCVRKTRKIDQGLEPLHQLLKNWVVTLDNGPKNSFWQQLARNYINQIKEEISEKRNLKLKILGIASKARIEIRRLERK